MLKTGYSYAVARIRGLESKILEMSFFERLIKESPEALLKNILETYLAESFAGASRPEDFTLGLLSDKKQTLNLLMEISPNKNIIGILRDESDFHNVKCLLLEKYFGIHSNSSLSNLGFMNVETLRKAILGEKFHDLRDSIKETVWSFNLKESHAPQDIATYIDNAYNSYVISVLANPDYDFLRNYFKERTDLINIQTFLKIKISNIEPEVINKSILTGGFLNAEIFSKLIYDTIDDFKIEMEKTNYDHIINIATEKLPDDINFYYTNKIIDNHFENYFRKIKYSAFGIEPLFAYYFEKQREWRRINSLFTGVLSEIDKDELLKRIY